MNVSFLGLGAIGTPMAERLAPAVSLTVWNRTGSRAQDFGSAHRARVAATPRDAADGAEVLITCLPTSADVESLFDGPDGLLAGLGPGTLFLDCTSGDPAASRRIAGRLAGQSVEFLDCPVSGGTDGAAAGTLTVMVGGSAEGFRRAQPVLGYFARRIEHLGPVGAGHAMKAVNNALLALNILAVGEGMLALARAGVDVDTAFRVLNSSSGRSFVSEKLVPDRVLTGLWPRTFRLALLSKDVGIARDLLRDTGVPGPMIDRAGGELAEALARLDSAADYLEPIRLLEQQTGTELRSTPRA